MALASCRVCSARRTANSEWRSARSGSSPNCAARDPSARRKLERRFSSLRFESASARAAEGNPPNAEASDPGAAVITVSENAAANAAPPFLADRVAALSARRLRASAL